MLQPPSFQRLGTILMRLNNPFPFLIKQTVTTDQSLPWKTNLINIIKNILFLKWTKHGSDVFLDFADALPFVKCELSLFKSGSSSIMLLPPLLFCCRLFCCRCCCCCFCCRCFFRVILQMPLVCHGLFHLLMLTYVHACDYFPLYFFPYFDRIDFNYLDRAVCLVVCTADGICLCVCPSAYAHLFALDFFVQFVHTLDWSDCEHTANDNIISYGSLLIHFCDIRFVFACDIFLIHTYAYS